MFAKLRVANLFFTVLVLEYNVNLPLSDGTVVWSGRTSNPNNTHVWVGTTLTLTLDDGRSGPIRVVKRTQDHITFVGTMSSPLVPVPSPGRTSLSNTSAVLK